MRGRWGHSGHRGGRGLRLADRGRGLSRVVALVLLLLLLLLLLLWLLLLLLLLLLRGLWHTRVRLNHPRSTRARGHPSHLSRSRPVSPHPRHPGSLLLLLL